MKATTSAIVFYVLSIAFFLLSMFKSGLEEYIVSLLLFIIARSFELESRTK